MCCTVQIEEHRICVCVRKRPLNKKGEVFLCYLLLSCDQTLRVTVSFRCLTRTNVTDNLNKRLLSRVIYEGSGRDHHSQ